MSTRALYTFIDGSSTFHVYKHYDGYPNGAIEFIKAAIEYAWEFPRFEAGDFGAAFVKANKDNGGGVYLSLGKHGDLSYRYEIRYNQEKQQLEIKAFNEDENKSIFEGTLTEFEKFVEEN